MRELQSLNEIKPFFQRVNIPEINITAQVMQRINNLSKEEQRKSIKPKILIIALSAIMIFCSGFAAIKVWEIRGSDGEMVLRYQVDQNLQTYDTSRYKDIVKDIKPGSGVVIYDRKVAENMCMEQIIPQPFKNIDDIKAKCDFNFKIPAALPDGYIFNEASVTFEPADHPNFDELKKESEEKNIDIVYRMIKLSDRVTSVNFSYNKDTKNSLINLMIMRVPGADWITDQKDEKVEKIKVNQQEALYIEHNNGGKEILLREVLPGEETTVFIDGKNQKAKYYLQYSISTSVIFEGDKAYSASKEDLLKLAENLN